MKTVCPICSRNVGTRLHTRIENVREGERVLVKHRIGRSPRHLRKVAGFRAGNKFSHHRIVNKAGGATALQPVCNGSGGYVSV